MHMAAMPQARRRCNRVTSIHDIFMLSQVLCGLTAAELEILVSARSVLHACWRPFRVLG